MFTHTLRRRQSGVKSARLTRVGNNYRSSRYGCTTECTSGKITTHQPDRALSSSSDYGKPLSPARVIGTTIWGGRSQRRRRIAHRRVRLKVLLRPTRRLRGKDIVDLAASIGSSSWTAGSTHMHLTATGARSETSLPAGSNLHRFTCKHGIHGYLVTSDDHQASSHDRSAGLTTLRSALGGLMKASS